MHFQHQMMLYVINKTDARKNGSNLTRKRDLQHCSTKNNIAYNPVQLFKKNKRIK